MSELFLHLDLKLESHLFGRNAIDLVGEPLLTSALKACLEADVILMGVFADGHHRKGELIHEGVA